MLNRIFVFREEEIMNALFLNSVEFQTPQLLKLHMVIGQKIISWVPVGPEVLGADEVLAYDVLQQYFVIIQVAASYYY